MGNKNRKIIKNNASALNQASSASSTSKSSNLKWIIAAAVVFLGLAIWGGISLFSSPNLSAISDIKIAESEFTDISKVAPRGVTKLHEVDGELYFVADTRGTENSNHYALFKYNSDTNSFSPVSGELGYINFIDGRFIYPKSHKQVDTENQLSITYYSNNAAWDDEKKLSVEETEEYIKKMEIRSAEIEGVEVEYTVRSPAIDFLTIKTNNGRQYEIILNFSKIIPRSIDGVTVGANSIIGISNGKVYFVGSYNVTQEEYRTDIFSVKLDGSDLKMIEVQYTTHEVGYEAFMDDDGYIYFHYSGKPNSYLMKLNCEDDKTELIKEVPGLLWGFVKNDDTILSHIDDDYMLDTPDGVMIIKY